MIKNLKNIFYYEVSLNSNNPQGNDWENKNLNSSKSMFYNSLSSNGDIILKFLREKFVILIKSFFLSPNPPKNCNFSIYDNLEITKEGLLEENMNILNSSTLDLDGKFENFVKNSSNSNLNYNLIGKNLENNKNNKNYSLNVKIEIINILSFIIRTYQDNDLINSEISKFIIDLVDIYFNKKEHPDLLENIQNLSKISLFFINFIFK